MGYPSIGCSRASFALIEISSDIVLGAAGGGLDGGVGIWMVLTMGVDFSELSVEPVGSKLICAMTIQ